MDLSLMAIDVDGTLHNPIVVASLATWCGIIAFVAAASGMAAGRKSHYARNRFILLAGLVLIEPFAVRIIGTIMYIVPAHQFFSVGFWGTPPFWVPVVVAVFCAALGYVPTRLRSRTLAT